MKGLLKLIFLAGLAPLTWQAAADDPPGGGMSMPSAIDQMSLEDLLRQEVTSVSKRPETLGDTAAAIFVISADDIARTGVRSVPEALRLAPGVEAVRLSANRWSISIRGGAERFANKLLLLLDGRNAYSQAFSGVFWENILPPLEDIARIEVIRGPGAAAWGTNAVNGVINIITKSAAATHGLRVQAGGGTREGAFASIAYGDELLDSSLHYRAYLRGQDGEPFELENGDDAEDEFDNISAGIRLDGYLADGARWDMSLDATDVSSTRESLLPVAAPPGFMPSVNEQTIESYALRGRYEQKGWREDDQLEIQGSISIIEAEFPALGRDERDTYEAEVNYRLGAIGRHSVRVGASLLHSEDHIEDGLLQKIQRASDPVTIYSVFGEDTMSLAERVTLTLGLRLDDHNVTGVEVQPTIRALWHVTDVHTLWASMARAARTPSRGERSFNYTLGFVAPGVPITLQGNEDFDTEYVLASELGYRAQFSSRLFADLTLFYNQYDDLRSLPATPGLVQQLENEGELDVYGGELSATWRIRPDLMATLNYAHNQTTAEKNQRLEAALVPRHIASLRVSWDICPTVGADLTAYHVDDRNEEEAGGFFHLEAFTSLNLALRWRASPSVIFRLVGQDLLESRQVETVARVPLQPPIAVPRGVFGDVTVSFW